MTLSVGVALALSAAISAQSALVSPAPIMPVSQSVEAYVREYFADIPELIAIASCESHFRHFNKNGEVLRNSGSTAMGVMQIMASIHQEAAKKLGLDIMTVEGNMAYARHLFEEQGLKPWNASKKCWSGKPQHLALANN